jgi:hypothetical protein
MTYTSVIQLDEPDFSEVIEVRYELDDNNKLRILCAIGHTTGSDYAEVISGYKRYIDRVEEMIANQFADAYKAIVEDGRY